MLRRCFSNSAAGDVKLHGTQQNLALGQLECETRLEWVEKEALQDSQQNRYFKMNGGTVPALRFSRNFKTLSLCWSVSTCCWK